MVRVYGLYYRTSLEDILICRVSTRKASFTRLNLSASRDGLQLKEGDVKTLRAEVIA